MTWCKLAILTDEVSQDLDAVIRFATEEKLDGIEVRSLFGKAFRDLSPDDLREIAKRAGDAGLAIAGAASPVFKCNIDAPAEIAEHVELFKRSVEAAQILGTDLVRVFTFLRRSHPATTDDLARAASHFGALAEIVCGTGIRIGIENEASCIMGNAAETAEFWRHLGKYDSFPSCPSPATDCSTLVWDPCNCLYLDGDEDPVGESFAQVAPLVGHVHIKDAARTGTKSAQKCVELGTGQLDFPSHFRALKAGGYRGWITLETHWRVVPLDDESQHLPAGHAFSAHAEPASRICIGHLREMISKA